MSSSLHSVACDLGAESGRAMLGRFDGERLVLTEAHRFRNRPVTLLGHLHWDVLSLFAEIKEGLGLAARQAEGPIASVGVDTWGVDFGLLDERDALLGNPTHYRDGRTVGMLDAVAQRIPRAELFDRTGIQFLELNTIYQLYAMAQQRDPMLAHARTLLMMPDLLHFWLAGRKASEFTIATTSQLYDPRAGGWALDLAARLDVPTDIFPDIVPPGTVLGPLRADIRQELGLHGSPAVVAPASHDTGSAVAGLPIRAPQNAAYISLGTWALFGTEVTAPIINEHSLAANFTNEGGVGGTFRFLKNLVGLWLVAECRRIWAQEGHNYTYDDLMDMAWAAPPLRHLIDPGDASLFAPAHMPHAIQALCQRQGQPVPEGRGEIVRCALESLAMAVHATLEGLEQVLGRRLAAIHVVGGGSRNPLVCQAIANATGLPLLAGPAEATAAGNVLVQAMALGHLASLVELREVVRRSFELTTYEPTDAALWQEAYGRWRETTSARY